MAKDERLYARFDIGMPEHPKVMLLSDAAFRALVECTMYARRQLTDGFLDERIALRMWGREVMEELASNHPERPSLERIDGGWQIRDYEEHQITRADIERKREAGRAGGLAKAKQASSKDVAPATEMLKQNPGTSLAMTETETELKTETSTSNEVDTSANEVRDDVIELCERLRDGIESNGSKPPNITTKWFDAARLMLDKDGRDLVLSLRLIDWCQQDPFWMSNILSMPKFREKYDQLRLAANRQIEERQQNLQPRPTAAQRNLATVAHFEQQALELEQ